ncbi:MAG: thiamine diphosphokinase [Oscillibacter sp.]|nr:thiamine diphosphokinase [Oscillibacter sp.]
MRRCVIIGGADIMDYDRICGYLRPDDFYICCDSGLKHRDGLGITPDLIIGDFDSHENPCLDIETIVLPVIKDDTDSTYAVKAALSRGFTDFLLIGAIGGRLDHTLGNVSLLLYLEAQGATAMALDDYSELLILSPSHPAQVECRYPFFSLLNISGTAKGVTIQNAKYPLENAEITCEYAYGVSNEVLPGKTAELTMKEGYLLLIKVL